MSKATCQEIQRCWAPHAKAGTMNIGSRLCSGFWSGWRSMRLYRATSPWAAGLSYPASNWSFSSRSWRSTLVGSPARPLGRVLLSLSLIGVIGIANLVSLVLLIHALVGGGANDSRKLLLAALQIWLTNIIVFGLTYWELDRGGPVQRAKLSRAELPPADFRFSQDEDDDAIDEVAASSSGRVDWAPVFADYLYVSVTNSSAFSPTDTMPLSSRAKLLMSIQAISALIVSLLVIAKAVSGLK